MNISVIANYQSYGFRILLEKVKCFFPDEVVLDLSRHTGDDWKKTDQNRIIDILNSGLVIVCQDWKDHIDVIHDLTVAQKGKIDVLIEFDGRFVPLTAQIASTW